ncbi:carbohydrate kinase [Coraliomargarita sinensis]|uniref:Carbohydrate kinase n=1 Tax=Coraliomargarita sinensis TaxID=2174842 RepID=A0A317ZED5_9BACT|nr:bifunctional ADP-heptose synthase [Coraliomargarita sinensis]PXA03686.1 carbohydrate kinase [Coraliomargarita sinensis]
MLPDFSSLRVLVIGDIMLDHYIWGDATRISPEAPVPVVGVERDSYVPGGAANVACNLSGLGVRTSLLGRYGPDDGGNRLGALLSERGIELSPIGCRKKSSTIVKTRVVVQRQQMCRIDRELSAEAYCLSNDLNSETVGRLLSGYHAIILSDYAKGTIDQKLIHLLRDSRAQGTRSGELGAEGLEQRAGGSFQVSGLKSQPSFPLLVLDPKPKRHLDLNGMDLMTPNRTEALQLAGMAYDPHAPFDDQQVCSAIYQRFAPENLVVTLGAEGMLLCHKDKVLGRLPTEAKEVFDVSGAGDTVVATLTAALASGLKLKDAAALANKAAGIVVSHVGTSPIQREALEQGAES